MQHTVIRIVQVSESISHVIASLFRAANAILAIPGCSYPILRAHRVATFALPIADYAWQLFDHMQSNGRRALRTAVLRIMRRSLLLHSRCSSLLVCAVGHIIPPGFRAGESRRSPHWRHASRHRGGVSSSRYGAGRRRPVGRRASSHPGPDFACHRHPRVTLGTGQVCSAYGI
jgi:hypothetical protein